MKSIRNLMTVAGLSVVLLALGTTGANAQMTTTTNFAGTFTLSHPAEWGTMVLPAGEYTLSYSQAFNGGTSIVAVAGKRDGITRGMVLVKANSDASTKRDALVCIREGDALVVRALEMPQIGTAANFALPRGTKLTAQKGNHNGYTQLAEASMRIERIPVTMNAK